MHFEISVLYDTIRAMNDNETIEKFRPVIHEEDGRYWAEIPAMPGCLTEGDTLDEVRANIVEAAQGWLEAKLEWLMGRVKPVPTSITAAALA